MWLDKEDPEGPIQIGIPFTGQDCLGSWAEHSSAYLH